MYASGHPDMATYREQGVGNLGLLVSRDGGRTWRSVALKGAVDLHALAYSPRNGGQLFGWNVTGQPGLYRISIRGTWRAIRARPAVFGAIALSVVLLNLVLPVVVLSLFRKRVDFFTFNPWLSRLPEWLASPEDAVDQVNNERRPECG